MSANFFELQKFAATGIASAGMTDFDKMRARALFPQSYPSQTITGIPPLHFKANGQPLAAWIISGNGQQSGTPSPQSIIMPTFCGKLVGADWTIPITCAGQTTPVYLGQTQTVRRVKKLVLTGEEVTWGNYVNGRARFIVSPLGILYSTASNLIISDRYNNTYTVPQLNNNSVENAIASYDGRIYIYTNGDYDIDTYKTYLTQQYAAGTPMTVWYVLATPETDIVNEPLAKIGDYADTMSSTNTGAPSIPTSKGSNTLSVGTTVQPSEVSITT